MPRRKLFYILGLTYVSASSRPLWFASKLLRKGDGAGYTRKRRCGGKTSCVYITHTGNAAKRALSSVLRKRSLPCPQSTPLPSDSNKAKIPSSYLLIKLGKIHWTKQAIRRIPGDGNKTEVPSSYLLISLNISPNQGDGIEAMFISSWCFVVLRFVVLSAIRQHSVQR